MDSVPGAMCEILIPGAVEPQEALLFGSTLWSEQKPEGRVLKFSFLFLFFNINLVL